MSASPPRTDMLSAWGGRDLLGHPSSEAIFSGLSLGLNAAKPAMLHHQGHPFIERNRFRAVFWRGFGRRSPFSEVDLTILRLLYLSDSRLWPALIQFYPLIFVTTLVTITASKLFIVLSPSTRRSSATGLNWGARFCPGFLSFDTLGYAPLAASASHSRAHAVIRLRVAASTS